jgi:hypothetical protein
MFDLMTAPGNGYLLTVLMIVFTACSAYAAGRIHQWYRTSMDRDEAYRDGYDTATQSLFSVAARAVRPGRTDNRAARGTATVTSILAAPGAVPEAEPADAVEAVADSHQGGRHTLPDELVQAKTYRLTPDRIARAKVPPPKVPQPNARTPPPNSAGDKTMRVAVPKPRAS